MLEVGAVMAGDQQWADALDTYAEACRQERRDEFAADLEPERAEYEAARYAAMAERQLD